MDNLVTVLLSVLDARLLQDRGLWVRLTLRKQVRTSTMLLCMRIRVARHSMKLSQAGLAARLHVSRSAVSNWEGGLATPTAGNLLMLAELARITFEWLAINRGSMKTAAADEIAPAVDGLLVYEPDELELIDLYRIGSGRQKLRLLQIARTYSANVSQRSTRTVGA